MLYINAEEQEKLLNMEEVVDAVAQSLRAYSEGKTDTPLRYVLPFNEDNRYLVMPALSDELKIVGLKTVTVAPNNSKQGKNTIVGSVILSDYETGETLAVLEGSYLTKIRTGAISGVATQYLARNDASTLCVIGTGDQAQGLIEAVLAVRDIKRIQCFNRTYDKAVKFAEMVQQQHKELEVEVYERVEHAIAGADVIVTATNAQTPVFDQMLEPGVHVNAVGSFKPDMQELPSQLIANADKVVVEAESAALEETGDLLTPISEGEFTANDLHGELGHIVAERLEGRVSDDEITVFKSVGVAIVDIVVANYFYRKKLNA
ncbi:ornithine cyclodeaminase family protein [Staphylococcus gallinarum]|uniref:ornithine cyclodeaminase family protein n=1 Tax=Staphylococcus gallinarum TaxID=1293 RepID=UPI000D1CED63|nr:ornithine cyclodeaminase family protein [Staphylococcus gallinarum]MBU7218140.1 ornithine cyclodeaminase family protein [Staphylococcus gallinarum]MCD8794643.1 ornithine cyclodeaminase family protein [Staphylococcus gallinarum]MCD8829750.1 ornithine cyclodeaminase family protein [Staphylococcus gallinarum]MCD8860002.1 ornithine cyclodeaminase family protein [Staphylococcus gallinarum]MDN6413474.1 ornithine cyclodeaminase family protein [Staphylococcus gallinarum]